MATPSARTHYSIPIGRRMKNLGSWAENHSAGSQSPTPTQARAPTQTWRLIKLIAQSQNCSIALNNLFWRHERLLSTAGLDQLSHCRNDHQQQLSLWLLSLLQQRELFRGP